MTLQNYIFFAEEEEEHLGGIDNWLFVQ